MARCIPVLLALLLAGPAAAQDGYTFSGTDAAPDSTIAAQTGVSQAGLDALDSQGGQPTEGSSIQRQETVSAGDKITFRYNFISEEGMNANQGANDVAFYAVDSNVSLLADTFDLLGGGSSGFMFPLVGGQSPPDETGYQTAEIFFQNGGTFDITIGVLDSGDRIVASVLLIDEVRLVPSTGGASTLIDGFESGLGGWSLVGDVLQDDGSFGEAPDAGQYQALLSTAADSVPEPASGLLLGLAALAGRRARRR